MKIEAIRVRNYKNFQDMSITDLPRMCIFLGANGAGKSTFFDIFGFLSDALRNNVTTAINRRGGFKEVVSRNQSGSIEFEIKFRNIAEEGARAPLITYILEIGEENHKPIILREILKYRRGQRTGKPWHFLDFSRGSGSAIKNEDEYGNEGATEDREEQSLESPDILAIKGLGQFQKFKAISAFRRLLENWFVSNFQIQAAHSVSDTGVSEHLSTTGNNLAQVTKFIYDRHPEIFKGILDKMRKRIPGVSKVEATDTPDGRIILRFQDGDFKDPFVARYVSDGTIKMFAYLVMLNDPTPHPLLCIEEPENFLHPALLVELCEEMREYARRAGQVFISTHSPDFVNAVQVDELFWITKTNGYSTIQRASDDQTVKALFEAGDPLGSLWTQKYLKGSDPR